jgi:XapX domain-containing protein
MIDEIGNICIGLLGTLALLSREKIYDILYMIDFQLLGQSFVLGFIVGLLFTVFNLPIPAPDNMSAIFGIIGLFCGMLLMQFLGLKFY